MLTLNNSPFITFFRLCQMSNSFFCLDLCPHWLFWWTTVMSSIKMPFIAKNPFRSPQCEKGSIFSRKTPIQLINLRFTPSTTVLLLLSSAGHVDVQLSYIINFIDIHSRNEKTRSLSQHHAWPTSPASPISIGKYLVSSESVPHPIHFSVIITRGLQGSNHKQQPLKIFWEVSPLRQNILLTNVFLSSTFAFFLESISFKHNSIITTNHSSVCYRLVTFCCYDTLIFSAISVFHRVSVEIPHDSLSAGEVSLIALDS